MQTSLFFSCDWGSTHFRLRLVDRASGRLLAQIRGDQGVRRMNEELLADTSLSRESHYACFLSRQIDLLRTTALERHPEQQTCLEGESFCALPVVVSGMASSSVGWREIPYGFLPCGLDGEGIPHASLPLCSDGTGPREAWLVSGLTNSRDMMRGEETEILGLFAGGRFEEVTQEGWLVLPGTHSKHVRLEAGRITHVRTFMTGELFDVLSRHSLLGVSVRATDYPSLSKDPQARGAFVEGVEASVRDGLAASLFQVRANTVLQGVKPSVNRWYLSGLLVGSEVMSLESSTEKGWVLLAASGELREAYLLAFGALQASERLILPEENEMELAVVRGQARLAMRWEEIAE